MENRNRVYSLPAATLPPSDFYAHAVALYNALGAFTEVYDSALQAGRISASDLEKPEMQVYRQAQTALDAAYAAIRPQDGGTAPEAVESGPSGSPAGSTGAEVSPDLDAFAEEVETLPPTAGVGSTEEERAPSQG